MKKILLVSNVKPNKDGVGNPIMVRMKSALGGNPRIEKVEFLPFRNSIFSLFEREAYPTRSVKIKETTKARMAYVSTMAAKMAPFMNSSGRFAKICIPATATFP